MGSVGWKNSSHTTHPNLRVLTVAASGGGQTTPPSLLLNIALEPRSNTLHPINLLPLDTARGPALPHIPPQNGQCPPPNKSRINPRPKIVQWRSAVVFVFPEM
jgi:hypothetical protein